MTGSPVEAVRQLKSESQKDIWLMGGGELFRTLVDAGQVDAIEVAVVPIILGEGIPFAPPGVRPLPLKLTDTIQYPSGIVLHRYDVSLG